MKPLFYLLILALLMTPFLSDGQHVQPKPPLDLIKQTIMPTAGPSRSPAGFINPADIAAQNNWDVTLSQKGGILHKIDQEDELAVLKFEKTALKIANEETGILPEVPSGVEVVTPVTPLVLSSFEANPDDGWFPPDNDMAISDDGFIVSVINSAVRYMDAEGNALTGNISFDNLLSSLGISNFLFDPKVLYDPVEDKFIMVVLSGNTPATSTVVVGFSVSQNPMDGWHYYTFNGAFLEDNWFDFPNIGISETDLFITGNLFHPDDGFDQTVVLQIDKSEGYVGGNVDWEYFGHVQNGNGGNAFTVVPASFGYDGEYGPGIFMVSDFGFGGSQVFLYEVTDSVNAAQSINVYSVNTSFYDAPGNVLQLGTTDVLDTGGCRIRDVFMRMAWCILCIALNTGGYSGIRYNRLNVTSLTNQTANFGQPQTDISYPSLVPFGLEETSNAVMINFLASNSSIYPQVGVINVDDDMVFSDPTIVKAGESFISPGNGNSQRWGDYSGGSRRHSSTYANAWFVGCYGKSSDYGNWIYEVSDVANGLPPIVQFEGTPKVGEVALNSFFNDLSINGVESYNWTFEGGTPASSTESGVLVNYDTPGKYDVNLIVTNAFGSDTLFKEEYINAKLSPVADYVADVTEGSAPLTVNFENLSINGETYAWAFPGGDPVSSTEENPTVVYSEPGTYNVNLVTANVSGTDTEPRFGYILVGAVGVDEEETIMGDLKVFPNPVAEVFTLDFFLPLKTVLDIFIVDASGKKVKTLLNGRVKAGRNILSFNKNALTAGTYFLIINDNQLNTIKNEKIIIAK